MQILHLITALENDVTHAGRFDPEMLTDQMRMEMFITPDSESEMQKLGDRDAACAWRGIDCAGEDGRVTAIDWSTEDFCISGIVDMRMMPPLTTYFNLYNEPLRGDMETSALPRTLAHFFVHYCHFTGTVDLGNLPPTLLDFYVSDNRITAISHVYNLPAALCFCFVSEGAIQSDVLRVGKLPEGDFMLNFEGSNKQSVLLEDEIDRDRVTF